MTERPIPFSAPMVRAILEGRKTQTRRILTEGKLWRHTGVTEAPEHGPFYLDDHSRLHCKYITAGEGMWKDGTNRCAILTTQGKMVRCHYGKPGDRLWVRETWQTYCDMDSVSPRDLPIGSPVQYPATWEWVSRRRSSIHMPRWASRILLEIADVRVQRLQEISEEDAIAEGTRAVSVADIPRGAAYTERHDFANIWNKINGSGAWDANPWVWAITFKQIDIKEAA